MPDLLTMSIEAIFSDTNKTKTFFTWPYAHATQSGHEFTETPDEAKFLTVEAATGAGETVDVADLTTVTYLLVYNTDGTNFVTVSFDNAAAATVAIKVLPGQCAVIPDVDPTAAVTLVADTGACICLVAVTGT